MRVNQLASYFQASLTQGLRPTGQATPRNLSSAQEANQGRLTDAAKGFVQATRVRDGLAASSAGLGQAQDLVKKAQASGLSAADRKQLQADLAKALAAVDQGAKEQTKALDSKLVANSTFAARRVGTESTDQLGRKASGQYASVADLAKLDLTTASADQLGEAAKVLEAAKGQTDAQLAATDRQVDRITGRIVKLETVQSALTGGAKPTQQQQNADAILAMLQQQRAQVTPGSLFSSFA